MAPEKTQRLDQFAGAKYMLPNLLVNPGFEIWQRGVGPFTASAAFTADEWALPGTGATATKETTEVHGGVSSLKIVTTANTSGIHQGVECYKSLEGLEVTFSVWVKSSNASVKAFLGDYNGSSEYATMAYHSGGGDWELLTCTKVIRTGLITESSWPHGFGIRVGVTQDDAVATYYVDSAVAVAAEVAFPEGLSYAPLNPAEDKARCQRFYETGLDVRTVRACGATSNSNQGAHTRSFQYKASKLATPTVTLANKSIKSLSAFGGTWSDRTSQESPPSRQYIYFYSDVDGFLSGIVWDEATYGPQMYNFGLDLSCDWSAEVT